MAAAGSLGVRGFISEVHGTIHEERVQAIRDALQELREHGVRRVHTILEPGDTLEMAARDVGFGPCPGETLFQRDVETPPSAIPSLPESFKLRDGTLEDLLKISNELTHIPELAFHGWEKLLIGRELDRSERYDGRICTFLTGVPSSPFNGNVIVTIPFEAVASTRSS